MVEGQENPFATLVTRKLYEVQKYVMLTEHIYARWAWFISKMTYDKLSDEHKKLVTQCAHDACEYASNWDRENEVKLMVDVQRKGMQIVVPDKRAFYEKAKPAIDELKKSWAPGLIKLVEEAIR